MSTKEAGNSPPSFRVEKSSSCPGQEVVLGSVTLKDSHFQWLLLFLWKYLQPLNLRSSEGLSLLFAQIHCTEMNLSSE